MIVLHLATSTNGGAGRAAMRLHLGLLKIGIDSRFLAMAGTSDPDNNIHIYNEEFASVFQKISYHFRARLRFIFKKKHIIHSEGKFEIYSSNNGRIGLKDHPLVKHADVINLHWIASFVDFQTFFNSIEIPIIWTLHDMNPFQGGFHYLNDQIRNEQLFKKTEIRIIQEKQRSYHLSAIKKIIAPSIWLKSVSKKSDLLDSFDHVHIPYSLDTTVFKPYDSEDSKNFFGLPLDQKVLMFLSEDTNNYRKGFDVLFSALKIYKGDKRPVLLAVGKKNNSYPDNVQFTGKLTNDVTLAKAYSAADVLILPSREDNFPNVMLESLSCGTPVIAAKIGGMQDVIKTGFNGILIDQLSDNELSKAISEFLNEKYQFDSKQIRKDSVEQFQLEIQAKRYKDEYLSVLNLTEE